VRTRPKETSAFPVVSSVPTTVGQLQSQSDFQRGSHVAPLGNGFVSNSRHPDSVRVGATEYLKHYGLEWQEGDFALFSMSIIIKESDHEMAQEKTTTMLNS
jgi:hypothetical protein